MGVALSASITCKNHHVSGQVLVPAAAQSLPSVCPTTETTDLNKRHHTQGTNVHTRLKVLHVALIINHDHIYYSVGLCVVFDIMCHQVVEGGIFGTASQHKGRLLWKKVHFKKMLLDAQHGCVHCQWVGRAERCERREGNNKQQGAKCGCENATCSARCVENSVVFWNSLFPECSTFPMAGVSSMVDWYGAFNGFYGSLCKERCTGWNNSVSAGPEADRGPGLMTGPSQTRGPLATSHSVCPPPGHPCWWSRARCFSEAWQMDDRKAEDYRKFTFSPPKKVRSRKGLLTRRGRLKHPGHQRSRLVSWHWLVHHHHWRLTASS